MLLTLATPIFIQQLIEVRNIPHDALGSVPRADIFDLYRGSNGEGALLPTLPMTSKSVLSYILGRNSLTKSFNLMNSKLLVVKERKSRGNRAMHSVHSYNGNLIGRMLCFDCCLIPWLCAPRRTFWAHSRLEGRRVES